MSVVEAWAPRTKLGQMVKEGKIVSIAQVFEMNIPIMEPEIVDMLLPNLQHEPLSHNLVQRQTDAGEISTFQILVIIGNFDGYIGLGVGKARLYRNAIEKAVTDAKLNITPVRRGCGSWECGCNTPHSVPFKVSGKAGSVEVTIIPAPKGVGLVASDAAKVVMRYAGVKDAWTKTKGETGGGGGASVNFIKATFNALKETYRLKTPKDWVREV